MGAPESLEQVVLVPRNGLGNRLQAWASAAIVAAQLDVPLRVMWEPEPPAPAAADDLFTPEALRRSFVDREWLDGLLDCRHEDLPRYLTVDASRRAVILAGHDRGEQVFMPDLPGALAHASQPRSLVIIAGGLFHLPSSEDFPRQRSYFYRALPWHAALVAAASEQSTPHQPYAALHIRQTDRSIEAPTAGALRRGLDRLARAVPERSLFIAADTPAARDRWMKESRERGFQPWHARDTVFERTVTSGALSAAVDWMLLAGATALVYPAASTFSAEAAVATGVTDASVPITASPARQRSRMWSGHVRNALTYPARHLRA
jgi:hypothetical protein